MNAYVNDRVHAGEMLRETHNGYVNGYVNDYAYVRGYVHGYAQNQSHHSHL